MHLILKQGVAAQVFIITIKLSLYKNVDAPNANDFLQLMKSDPLIFGQFCM